MAAERLNPIQKAGRNVPQLLERSWAVGCFPGPSIGRCLVETVVTDGHDSGALALHVIMVTKWRHNWATNLKISQIDQRPYSGRSQGSETAEDLRLKV